MFDYHVHTAFSADSEASIEEYIAVAADRGLREICFTDHYDLEFPALSAAGKSWEGDIASACRAIDALQLPSGLTVKKGVEMGLRLEEGIIGRTLAALKDLPLDFVIASVHLVDGVDPYFPDYFEGKSRSEGFARYLETIYACLQQTDDYQAVGHIGYPSKGCPYPNRALQYADAPEIIDALFRHVIEKGKCIEINGSVLARLGDESPDVALYRRYVELGGEYITFGSDAHTVEALGQQFGKIKALAEAAGIRYAATFAQKQPSFFPIASL